MALSTVIAIIIPIIIIYFIHKKHMIKSNVKFVVASVIIFIILFFLIVNLLSIFTVRCGGPGISCTSFEYYEDNGTCEYQFEVLNNTEYCTELKGRYTQQMTSGNKHCPEGYMDVVT